MGTRAEDLGRLTVNKLPNCQSIADSLVNMYLPVKGHSVVNIFRELCYGQLSVFAITLLSRIRDT